MKISIHGLGGRLQRARKGTGLSQEAIAEKIGVSWMTVHRWERSQRSISEENLDLLCDLYDKPLRWFLTLEDGDLEQEDVPSETGASVAPVQQQRNVYRARLPTLLPAIDRWLKRS